MLSQKVFKQGLKELEECFDNFKVTEEKMRGWYKHSKHLDDHKWQQKIASCIKGCRKVPTLADILDIKGWYSEITPPYHKDAEKDNYDYSKSECPDDIKDRIRSVGVKV